MSATVTFIIPAYNAEKYLAEAVESVLKQTIDCWQLIIIDDGSTDNTLKIAEKYSLSDPRISVISCATASGSAFLPRKIGAEKASTSIISPLDADDRIPPEYLENLLSVKNKFEADILYPLMYEWKGASCRPVIDPGNTEAAGLKPGEEMKAYIKSLYRPKPGKEMVCRTLDGWKVNCNGGLIDRDLYLRAFALFPYNPSNANADEILSRQLLILSKCVVFTQEKYYYRVNPESITRKYSPKRFDTLKASVYTFDLIKNNYPADSEEYMLAQRQMIHVCAYYMQLINEEFPRSARNYGIQQIEETLKSIDFALLRPHVRPRLWHLMQMPVKRALILMGIKDKGKYALSQSFALCKKCLRPFKTRIKEYFERRDEASEYESEIKSLKGGQLLRGSDSDVYRRNYYSDSESAINSPGRGDVICPLDGTLRHGGLTDRLRGVLSTYAEAKRLGHSFHICWTSPFRLEDFLLPSKVDWRIEPEKIVRDNSVATPVVIQDVSPQIAKRLTREALKNINGDLHVYSNSDAQAGNYKELYRDLFVPSPLLADALNFHLKSLPDGYWAFAFRFIGLLGDFEDCITNTLEPPAQESLMEIARDEMLRIMKNLPNGYRVLVTSDSRRFLDFVASADRRIYTVPGDIIHIDLRKGEYDEAWLKTFVDQYLLMGAERVYRMRTEGMYPTGFPKFAAEVGGAEFIDHIF